MEYYLEVSSLEKTRVYEIAKELNISSKVLVDALQQVGIEVRSHMSTLEPEVVDLIRIMILGQAPEQGQPIEEKTQSQVKEEKEVKIIEDQVVDVQLDNNVIHTNEAPEAVVEPVKKPTKKIIEKLTEEVAPDIPEELISDYTIIKHSKSVEEIWEEEIAKEKVITSGPNKSKKRRKKSRSKNSPTEKPTAIEIAPLITVGELAKQMQESPNTILSSLVQLGIMSNINQPIDPEAAILIGEELGVTITIAKDAAELLLEDDDDPNDLVGRPPIITVMGHVDHGKTSLLDRIRNANVQVGEAGGITQHVGAYQTEVNGQKITFIDTPGHAAFTAMRARGAQVTDIVILVVAADDGVMPQTIEAINHAKAAGVPIIVAVNKCDKFNANPDRVKQELSQYELIPEEWGGNTIFVNISALTGDNIDVLLESVLLVAEMEEFKANPKRLAQGTVIESRIAKGQGRVATVIMQNGTLSPGQAFVVGNYYGKAKTISNYLGKGIKSAGPSTPILIAGLDGLPEPGDTLVGFDDEREAHDIAAKRQETARQLEIRSQSTSRLSIDDLFARMQDENETHTLNIIVKADVQGTLEAIHGSISLLNEKDTRIKFDIIHTGVGPVNESDVMLATASDAFIFGFNVNADSAARKSADEDQIEMRFYTVIYNLLENLEKLGKGMLDPVYEEVIIGSATVRTTFKVPKIGTIAGCYVTEGVIKRSSKVRLFRQGLLIHEGAISSLKRFKDDVSEVATGYECGIGIDKYNDLKEDDVIEAYEMKEKPAE